MKTKLLLFSLLLIAAVMARAATGDLTSELQKGLFEEEANRNLDAAIQAYQSVVTRFDKDRQTAATAIFRLGECYRKLGKTNDAVAQYERIIREFPDQKPLAVISQQNVAGMGIKPSAASKTVTFPPTPFPEDNEKALAPTDEEEKEIRRIREIIRNSPDLINAVSGISNMTPLASAASKGQMRVAEFLLNGVADVNLKSKNMTPLQNAAAGGHKKMVELLLARGAEVDSRDDYGRTALHLAAERRFQSVVESLVAAKADVNARDNGSNTPLMLAAQQNSLPMATLLLARGAEPNGLNKQRRGYGQPNSPAEGRGFYGAALHMAAVHESPAMTALLLTNRTQVHLRNLTGETALDIAAALGKTEVVAQLIAAGADVNAAGPRMPGGGATPLDLAVNGSHRDVVKLLLDKGADPNGFQINPLAVAVRKGDVEIISLLLKHKADPNGEGGEDSMPLLVVRNHNPNPDIMRMLLTNGANPNLLSPADGTPLLVSVVQFGRTKELVAPLIEAKANVNAQDRRGMTALYHAVASGRSDLAELLLAAGANPNLRENTGSTPLDVAKQASSKSPSAPGQIPSHPVIISGPSGAISQQPERQIQSNPSDIAALLRRHGAQDDVPRLDWIEVRRPSGNFSRVIFRRSTNDYNRFTLVELVAVNYGLLTSFPSGSTVASVGRGRSLHYPNMLGSMENQHGDKPPLPFPDFARLVIRRPRPDGQSREDVKVNLAALLETGDPSNDIPLEWGDVVEIPELDHPIVEKWKGLSAAELEGFKKLLARNIGIKIKGETSQITLTPDIDVQEGTIKSIRNNRPFYLQPVLEESKLPRASSDLSRVRVTRQNPRTGQIQEWLLDCSTPKNPPDFWLRDGDQIEVPDKQ